MSNTLSLSISDNYRIICSCQIHARRQRSLWRRSLRAGKRAASALGKRGAALLAGIPLSLALAGIPIEATNLSIPHLMSAGTRQSEPMRSLEIFKRHDRRATPLPDQHRQTFTLEVAKEEFFRTRVPYGSLIYREAHRNQLPPELVAAIVEAESDFRPDLISEKDARGLMQIVPSTGNLFGAGDLLNPSANVAAGTRYLRYLTDRFGGDQRLILAAYNAGEGVVERCSCVPDFAETQDYIRRVGVNSRNYARGIRGSYTALLRLRYPQ